MDLTKAVKLFEELRSKISEHRNYLSGNETVTRVLLVDPVLDLLGWDVRNPHIVELEFEPAVSNRSAADYVLKADGNNVAIVEAKRFGTNIDELRHREQADGYARYAGVKFFVLSDGGVWSLYERDLMTSIEVLTPKVRFDLVNDDLVACALKALSMWRVNLGSGSEPTAAKAPRLCVATENDTKSTTKDFAQQSVNLDATQSDDAGETNQYQGDEWLTLDAVGFQTHDPWPKELILPGGEPEKCPNYRTLWIKLANWLFETSPTKWKEYFGEFVGASHGDLPSHSRPRKLSNEYWIRANYSTVAHGKNIKAALRHFGVDLRRIRLRFN